MKPHSAAGKPLRADAGDLWPHLLSAQNLGSIKQNLTGNMHIFTESQGQTCTLFWTNQEKTTPIVKQGALTTCVPTIHMTRLYFDVTNSKSKAVKGDLLIFHLSV